MSRFSLLFISISALLLALSGGCADDLRRRNIFDAGAGEVTISFSVDKVDLTRSDDSQQMESAIDHAYLLFYNNDATIGISVPVAAVRAVISPTNNTELTFKMPLSLNPATDYKLLALANADDYVPEGFNYFADYIQSWSTKTPDERGELILFRNDRIPTTGSLLPMLGKVTGSDSFRFSVQNGGYQVSTSLSFRRMASRIDVANMVKTGFKVEGVALCNWRNAVSVVSMLNGQSNRAGLIRGVLSDDAADVSDGIFIDMPAVDDSGIQQLQNAVYCLPSVCFDSYASDKESTALIIKGKYGDDTESSYYRVNVGVSGNKTEVKANTKYLLTIQSVKGRGASTVKEAYASDESQIVLSIVEDWDLDGNFAMDDKGNFIVISRGSLEFESDELVNKEVKVLTSKGLSWTAEYTADNTESESAFTATKLSNSSLAISPVAENKENTVLSGNFIVTATTSDGSNLSVNISVSQNAGEGGFVAPAIPENMPFALTTQSDNRVNIDHVNKTIEIDGFDPDCFNSFIDIPFTVYANQEYESESLIISHTFATPVEGIVSKKKMGDDWVYCPNSFTSSLNLYSKSQNKEVTSSMASETSNSSINAKKDDVIYISVGAMGPDDPAIVRTISISKYMSSEKIEYTLTIKPRRVIIDDVVITDENGMLWMVNDRNIQNMSSDKDFKDFVGRRKSDGSKYQAYNFVTLSSSAVTIPFKFNSQGSAFNESTHELYHGLSVTFSNKENNATLRTDWLQKYLYSDGQDRTSPFYEEENYLQWIYPTKALMELFSQRMCVSKLRMFLVSEVSVKSGRESIPVCCYWPFYGTPSDNNNSLQFTDGYYIDSGSGNTDALVYLYCDKTSVKFVVPSSIRTNPGLSRLVRPLSKEELESYKKNYLGHGNQKHRLTICHPDTYESESLGWLPY